MPLPALRGGSPRTLGSRLRHSRLAGSTAAGLAVAAALSLTAGVHRSASKVLPMCVTVGILAEVSIRVVLLRLFFGPQGWGLQGPVFCTRSLLTCTVRFGFSLSLFAPGLWARTVRVVAYWRPHSTHSQGHRRRFSRRKVPDNAPATCLDGCRTSLPGSCELTKWFLGFVVPCRDVVFPEQGLDFIGAGLPAQSSIPHCSSVFVFCCSTWSRFGLGLCWCWFVRVSWAGFIWKSRCSAWLTPMDFLFGVLRQRGVRVPMVRLRGRQRRDPR